MTCQRNGDPFPHGVLIREILGEGEPVKCGTDTSLMAEAIETEQGLIIFNMSEN